MEAATCWVVTSGLMSPVQQSRVAHPSQLSGGPPFVVFEGWDSRMLTADVPNALLYRFDWPRAIFLTFGFFDPRG